MKYKIILNGASFLYIDNAGVILDKRRIDAPKHKSICNYKVTKEENENVGGRR